MPQQRWKPTRSLPRPVCPARALAAAGPLLPGAGLLLLLVVGLLVAANLPLSYPIDVGVGAGYGSDLPMLRHFNTPERDEHGTYRWTQDGAQILLPGLGHRPVVIQFDFNPISPQVAATGPQHIDLSANGNPFVVLPVSQEGRQHHLLLPPLHGGDLALTFHTATFTPPDDPRTLGTPLASVKVRSVRSGWDSSLLTAPSWGAVGMWGLAVLLLWGTVLLALKHERGVLRWSLWLLAGVAFLVVLAACLDLPRWAFGALPALAATASSGVLVVVLRPLLPALAARLGVVLNARTCGWLLLIMAVAFGVRLGGRLYPWSMWGDVGFHANRFIDTIGVGKVYLLSAHRGIDNPYPPGPYFTVAPLLLLLPDLRLLLQVVAALADAWGAALVYVVTVRGLHASPGPRPGRLQTTALLAAACYVFTAAGLMLTWWSFDTHIYTQCATLVLVTALILVGTDPPPSSAPPHLSPASWSLVLGVLMTGVFLGHMSFLINTILTGGLLLGLTWLAAWRGNSRARTLRWPLTLAALGAGGVAGFLFYQVYFWLFIPQIRTLVAGGVRGVSERDPTPPDLLWQVLWEAGLIQHFGFFPLLLIPLGLWVLWRGGRASEPRRVLLAVMGCTLLVSAGFALLPFLTLSTIVTRWLTFAAWAVSIGAALAFRVIWRSGQAGQLVGLAMAGFVVWNTVIFWFEPMVWRIRPPEPF
jgi:hypothetical protein